MSSNCSTPADHSATVFERSMQISLAFAPLGSDAQQLMSLSSPNSSPCEFMASVGLEGHFQDLTLTKVWGESA